MGDETTDVREQMRALDRAAEQGGGEARIEKQHADGKLTARERLQKLLDPGSFAEIDRYKTHRTHEFGMQKRKYPGDGLVGGYGTIGGRTVFVYAQDFTVMGGSLSGANAEKICKIMEMAMRVGAPLIALQDSGGARIQEGVVSLGGFADIFLRNTLASGVIPQFSVIMGPCAGGAVYSPAITDFVVMVDRTAHMFITGPNVIKTVTRESVSKETLGGARTHATRSGVAHFVARDEPAGLDLVKELLAYVPSNNTADPPFVETDDPVDRRVPARVDLGPTNPNKSYDVHELIRAVVDDRRFLEVHASFAPNIVVGFARMGGFSVGIVANQPSHLAGCLDIDASVKAARFIRFCDAFNVPILTLEDVPGFLPGTDQEFGGIIRHGAKLLYAYAEATVPKITIITRKSYGGAYCVMGSKHVRADLNFAFPTAEVAVMGPDGAVNIVFRRELEAAEDREAAKAKLVADYREQFANPFRVAELGFIDEVIAPEDTRPKVIQGLRMLRNKRDTNPPKKHGNIPL